MFEVIQKIQSILNIVKGFMVGTTSSNHKECIIDYKGKRFVVSFKEIENPNEDIFEDIDKYL